MHKFQYKFHLFFILLFIGLISQPLLAQRDIPDKPQEQTSVYDDADMLSHSEKQQLEQKLINYADTTSTQIVVVTIPSLEGEEIGTYAAEWGHKWGIGQEDKDNGVLIMVAKKDHRYFISTGYGVEADLTDAKADKISQKILRPAFKKKEYAKGLDQATTVVMGILSGKFNGVPHNGQANEGFSISRLLPIIIIIIIVIIVAQRSNKGKGKGGDGNRNGNEGLFAAILLSSLGRGRGIGGGGFGGGLGGGGFGGGGFGGGFGGGGFGGGGAGGSW